MFVMKYADYSHLYIGSGLCFPYQNKTAEAMRPMMKKKVHLRESELQDCCFFLNGSEKLKRQLLLGFFLFLFLAVYSPAIFFSDKISKLILSLN